MERIESERKILITGGSGSLGQGFPPTAVRLASRLEDSQESWAAELNKVAMYGACIIHMAALTSVDECEKNPEKCMSLNSEATLKIFKASQAAGISRFIFVSTSHVYASSKEPLSVESPTEPKAMYPKSKLFAENLLKEEANKPENKMGLSIARVFSLIGPNMKPGFLYPALVERAKRRDPSPIPGFDNIRDFVNIKDVVATLTRLASSRDFPALVNVCTGQGKTVGELAREVFLEQKVPLELLQGTTGRASDLNIMVGIPTEFE